MQVVSVPLSQIKPYDKNPRKNDDAVAAVAASINEFGFQQPIVVDAEGVIIAGHTRFRAAKKLKLKEVPVVYATELTPEQVRAYRLADNKTGELAEWDFTLLNEELDLILDIDMSAFGFVDMDEAINGKKKIYSDKVNVPQYEITGDKPDISELIQSSEKEATLIEDILSSNVSDDEKQFLIKAAARHVVFNYRNIAEYYAHASEEMQELMERSALVIIDYDDAIVQGYVHLNTEISDMLAVDMAAGRSEDSVE